MNNLPPGAGGGRRYDIEWECSNAEGGKRVDTQVSLLTFRELRSAFLKKETLSPDHDDFGSDLSILWSTSILLTYYETVGDQRWDRLLNQMMNDACAEVEEAETEWETMTIPESCVGLVIGKNGAAVKQLQEKSGAYIEVQRDDDRKPGANVREVYLTRDSGGAESVEVAKKLILEMVEEDKRRRAQRTQNGGRGRGRGRGRGGGRGGGGGGGGRR